MKNIQDVLDSVNEQVCALGEIHDAIEQNKEFFDELSASPHVAQIMASHTGIRIYPRDAHALKKESFDPRGLLLSRVSLTGSSYNWSTSIDNCSIEIIASETQDLNGTIVQ